MPFSLVLGEGEIVKRITPQEVVEAYRKTGIKPIEGYYLRDDDGVRCGCALGALYLAAGNPFNDMEASSWATQTFGIEYECAFMGAFDGIDEEEESDSEECVTIARMDGIAAREACIAAGLEFA
jgi:hypothetical protein